MSEPALELPKTLYPLDPIEQEVRAQVHAFEAALAGLMETHAGKWVVWLNGLQSAHGTHAEALAWAYDHLDESHGFAVVQVAPRRPITLSGLAARGL